LLKDANQTTFNKTIDFIKPGCSWRPYEKAHCMLLTVAHWHCYQPHHEEESKTSCNA
jgi:hypothetical protein